MPSLDLNSDTEKKLVDEIFNSAIDVLTGGGQGGVSSGGGEFSLSDEVFTRPSTC